MPPTSSISPSPAKRQKPNVGSALRKPGPDYDKGINYWNGVEASVDGVLGGFGNGPVPHIEQLSSRLLLLSLLPSLQKFPSPLTPTPPSRPSHRLIALDVGAGIGRVSRQVLLPLFDDVITLEPVDKFIKEAVRAASEGEWRDLPSRDGDKEMERRREDEERGKRVWFIKGGLQGLDPRFPSRGAESLGVVGECKVGEGSTAFGKGSQDDGVEEDGIEYDVIWLQWCLGHMSTPDLIPFLRRARTALRQDSIVETTQGYTSLIFVKENCCEDGPDGKPAEFLDEEDSSLTRSSGKWLEIFKEAGLEVVKEEIQEGMPEELFVVKTWALR